jgi:hypothetical protein
MWDHLRHLRWMLAHGHPVRTVMLQLDLGEDYGRDRSGFQMLRMPHPEISGDSALLVAGDYLLRPHLRASMAKIEVNRGYGGQRLVHWPGGWWSAPERDALIEKDCPAHSAAHMGKTKLFAIGRASHLDRIAHNLSDLAAFLDVARAHRIKVVVYTTPFNRHALDQIDPDLYRQWLAGVARLTSFYNYAYYTPWANNDCLYYEDSHFTPALGRKLVADLFGDHAVGNRVTAENAASMLASAAENLRRNRAPRVDQVATRGLGPRQVRPASETQSAGWDPTH